MGFGKCSTWATKQAQVFVPDKHFQPSLMFASKDGAFPFCYLSDDPLFGWLTALPAKICTGLAGTNALAYLPAVTVMRKNVFKSLTTEGQCYKTFCGRNL